MLYTEDSEETQYGHMKKILMYCIITVGNGSENLCLVQKTVMDIDIFKQTVKEIINKQKWYFVIIRV
jgi:hypothetical protein